MDKLSHAIADGIEQQIGEGESLSPISALVGQLADQLASQASLSQQIAETHKKLAEEMSANAAIQQSVATVVKKLAGMLPTSQTAEDYDTIASANGPMYIKNDLVRGFKLTGNITRQTGGQLTKMTLVANISIAVSNNVITMRGLELGVSKAEHGPVVGDSQNMTGTMQLSVKGELRFHYSARVTSSTNFSQSGVFRLTLAPTVSGFVIVATELRM